ncbi:restriction endonuclease subunit S [Leptospira interrogans serovar Szwajizak]|uniref:restriction endonuclease subunit S n=1 Tax=Leptospira interrogans TaxID=173 RepID=UPI00034D7F52|nr:restriction endonuclease subunit S [Leptospira interrogans]
MKQKERIEVKRNVPRLRFPEFKNAGDWDEVGGDSLFDSIVNKNHDSNLPILAITQEYGAIPRNQIDYQVYVAEKSIESYKVVEPGDFIISLRSFQGGIEYSNFLGICSPAYIILRKKNTLYDHFYRHFFKTETYIRSLNKNIEGIRDGKMVSFKQFSELFIPLPSLPEQQKIADCLSSIDELISIQAQKLDALKSHKKGLLQQLFPAEGETVPRLRFPEFRGAGEWEERKLGEMCERIVEKVCDNVLIPVSITSGFGFVAQSNKFGRDISGNQYKNYIYIRKGDIAYNRGYSKKFPQGSIYELKEFEAAAASSAFICFKFLSQYNTNFFKGFFDQNYHGSQLKRFLTSGARSDGLLNNVSSV